MVLCMCAVKDLLLSFSVLWLSSLCYLPYLCVCSSIYLWFCSLPVYMCILFID